MVSPGLWGRFLFSLPFFFPSLFLPFSFFPSFPPSPFPSPRLGLACPGQGAPSARRALGLARWHPWRPQFKNQDQCARWPLRCSSCAVTVPLVSMVCPQRSAPSVCAPSARRALGSARPQLSTPLASAPSVQEPRSVLVCRRPVVFIMIMCSSCAVCPWWALGVCALGQVRPRPSAPSARRALTSARTRPRFKNQHHCAPPAPVPAVFVMCSVPLVCPQCSAPSVHVPSARRAFGSACPRPSAPSAEGKGRPGWRGANVGQQPAARLRSDTQRNPCRSMRTCRSPGHCIAAAGHRTTTDRTTGRNNAGSLLI